MATVVLSNGERYVMSDILAQLAEIGITGILARQDGYKALATVLNDGETIRAACAGTYGDTCGAAAATDQRLILAGRTSGLFKKVRSESFPYSSLSSVGVKTGIAQGSIEFYASGNSAKLDKVSNAHATAFADAVRRLMAPSKAQPAQGALLDIADQLAKLAALRDQGILSDAEFAAQKAKLLGM